MELLVSRQQVEPPASSSSSDKAASRTTKNTRRHQSPPVAIGISSERLGQKLRKLKREQEAEEENMATLTAGAASSGLSRQAMEPAEQEEAQASREQLLEPDSPSSFHDGFSDEFDSDEEASAAAAAEEEEEEEEDDDEEEFFVQDLDQSLAWSSDEPRKVELARLEQAAAQLRLKRAITISQQGRLASGRNDAMGLEHSDPYHHHHHHHEYHHYHQYNPMKMRTIFSCMWPSCTRNCDSLDEIEQHVRLHLGPKQFDSIGDEDFYYEETEVDEATYLALFSEQMSSQKARQQHKNGTGGQGGQVGGPLSPSHNSDGLSSGQSFASSSPASSPVCSSDSSPSVAQSLALNGHSQQPLVFGNSSTIQQQLFAGQQQQQSEFGRFRGLAAGVYCPPPQGNYFTSASSYSSPSPQTSRPRGRRKKQRGQQFCSDEQQLQFSLELATSPNVAQLQPRRATCGRKRQQPEVARNHHQLQEASVSAAAKLVALADHTYNSAPPQKQTGGGPLLQNTVIEPLPLASNGRRSTGGGGGCSAIGGRRRGSSSSSGDIENENLTHKHLINFAQMQQQAQDEKQPKMEDDDVEMLTSDNNNSSRLQLVDSTKCLRKNNHLNQEIFHHYQKLPPKATSGGEQTKSTSFSSSSPSSSSASSLAMSNVVERRQLNGIVNDNSSHHQRLKNENRKCRKVYGMDRRDLWCTQCKWKKACSRFCDQ